MHTHVQREEASASYNFGWFRPTAWPPLFPVGYQTSGYWQGCASPKLINVYQCSHAYHDPQAGSVFCHGGCLTGICLSLIATKSAVMVIVVIDCFVLLTSPSRSEKQGLRTKQLTTTQRLQQSS